ncbi:MULTISPECIES: phosphopantetheine-binding protein [Polyangium]|uniref:Acyl carrier protein n=2 Tax=Polyangium TaxID=55 RepID=A0A4U1JDA9_9BACT|nr:MULTISPECIES: phosphopantetheine-binding protein [Polyangium]MDI1432356.1 phosphopantetheine-binding protein [Polyangium sorediatum]TKD07532.1 acyl carrier protein [Polyangium fumosum]
MSEANDPEIAAQVRLIVAEALALDPAAVKNESLLMADLGAESLDYLDIVFKIERTFGIQITRGEMQKAARGDMSDEEFAPGGVVSDKGLERLRELMPEAKDRIEPGLRAVQILGLFSVQTFVNMVEAKKRGVVV